MRVIASFMAFNLLLSLAAPMQALALTGGPSQPEVQSFEPISANQMVDPFTGDFTYNIPLLDVGGYPINIAYHAAPGLDEEASWVGLGWNINPGVINRNMRGIPDDFNGQDKIKKTLHMKNNIEVELRYKRSTELFGWVKTENDFTKELMDTKVYKGLAWAIGLGVKYNNYKGFGYNLLGGLDFRNKKGEGPFGLGVDLKLDNEQGADLDVSLDVKYKKHLFGGNMISGSSIATGVNSRQGMKALQLGVSYGLVINDRKNFMNREGNSNGSASLSFNSPSYMPTSTPAYKSLGLSFDYTPSTDIQGIHPKNTFGITASINGVRKNGDVVEYAAYGFLHNNKTQKALKDRDRALMDFNRDGGSVLNKFTKYLPFAYNTHDVLSVSGQGISGVYRPFYSSVGTVTDPFSRNSIDVSLGAGLDLAVGPQQKFGLAINANFYRTASGGWVNNRNKAYQYVKFNLEGSNIDFEPAYYKNVGEKAKTDIDFFNKIGDYNPVSIDMDRGFFIAEMKTTATSFNADGTTSSLNLLSGWTREKREKRNQVISYLSVDESKDFGLVYDKQFTQPALGNNHKDWHIGEYTVTNPDGSRYVYGLPAYNNKQIEVSFNIGDKTTVNNRCNGLVNYSHNNIGNSNKKGVDYFYSKNEMPEFAHSYMLSAILSPDYIDINGDGPTEDDFGNYTFIEYERVYENYKWRTPYTQTSTSATTWEANLQRQYESDNFDDKASYIYGEKEIWYIKQIKTKTHIAIFHTSGRADGLEAHGENGGKDLAGRTLKQLDKIELFSLEDYNLNGTNATPIKVVHFKYDYSLCPNVPNNNNSNVFDEDMNNINIRHGKLTLKEISFSYGKSRLGKESPYIFDYHEGTQSSPNPSENPPYQYKAYERWGNYKPNDCIANEPRSDEFPYSVQDDRSNKSDVYAAVWSLKEITLPSGGTIKIQYEADDYAYVQNKKAMEMVKVLGAGIDNSGAYGNELYNGASNHNYLYFTYRNDDPNVTFTKDILKERYWNGDKYIYYSFNNDLEGGNYEQVSGYAEVEDWGIQSTVNKLAWVKIKNATFERKLKSPSTTNINPISKMSWQFARLNLPHLVYPGSNLNKRATPSDLFFFIPEINRMIQGYENVCFKQERGRIFKPQKSWVRLVSPESKKIGGGYRVKKIEMVDNWETITNNSTNEENATLGQVYSYETYDEATDRMISSGVASYEPLVGGDENPFRYANNGLELQKNNLFTPSNIVTHDAPIGESVYSSASVGYSKVTVRNLKPSDLDPLSTETITRHATGYSVFEFYTAKEFPIIVRETPIHVDIKRKQLLKLIGFSFERATGAQGFSVELNDMHGRTKSQFIYDENNNRISGVEHFYKVKNENSKSFELDNTATILKKDGTVEENATLGVEVEMVVDPQQKIENNFSGSFSNDMDGITLGIIPFLPILSFYLNFSVHESKIRTVTTNKIINKYALLDRVVAYDQDAKITTKNLAWDGETGEVLLTETENEYDNNIYNLTYPAHWAYDGMGQAYKNIGLEFELDGGASGNSTVTNGKATVTNALEQLLHPGDELIRTDGVTPLKVWVLDKDAITNEITLVLRDGTKPLNGSYDFKVIRSGRRNMQSTAIASVVSKETPLDLTNFIFGNKAQFSSVINSSAVQFSNEWQTYSFDPGCWIAGCESQYTIYPNPNGDCSTLFNGAVGYDIRNLYESLFASNILSPPGIPSHSIFPDSRTVFPDKYDVINPYIWGVRGNWRPHKSYIYFDRRDNSFARTQTAGGLNNTYTKNDGTLVDYEPFWLPNSGSEWTTATVTNNPWIASTEVTQVSPDGFEVENKDALDIYSAAQYSYVNKLPVAVANNAKLNEIVFENFEDYDVTTHDYFDCSDEMPGTATPNTTTIKNSYLMTKVASSPMHWYLWPELKMALTDDNHVKVTNTTYHTGYKSLEIRGDTVEIPVHTNPTNSNYNTTPLLSEYRSEKQDFVSVFEPTANSDQSEYILSYWKRTENDATSDIIIYIPATSTTIPLSQIGADNKVEKWVRREFKFTIPTSTTYFEIKIFNSSNNLSDIAYFDDIRIFPSDANMKGFVYDNTNLRLMAELDENNYATLFEYDEEGNLIRTKKETERGIITLSENRENIKK